MKATTKKISEGEYAVAVDGREPMPTINYDVRVSSVTRLRVNKCEGQATLIVRGAFAPNQWMTECVIALTPDEVNALIAALKATQD